MKNVGYYNGEMGLQEQVKAELQKCIDAMDSNGVCFVYWECTRGTAPRNHLFPDVEPNLIININESSFTDLRKPCKLITMEDIILQKSGSGMELLRPYLSENYVHQAASEILSWNRGTVFLTTGFYVAGFAETDGPCGFHASDPLTMQKTVKTAAIKNSSDAIKQVITIIKKGTVISVTGKEIPLEPDSVCVHGDTPQALEFVKEIRTELERNGIKIQKLSEM